MDTNGNRTISTTAPEAGSPVIRMLLGSVPPKSRKKSKSAPRQRQWPTVLEHEDQWEAMLLLRIDAARLRDAFDQTPVTDLMVRRKDLAMNNNTTTTSNHRARLNSWPTDEDNTSPRLCHRLMNRLVQSISVYPLLVNNSTNGTMDGSDDVEQWDHIVCRTRNAMVILGVLLGSLIERPFVDFNEHVMRIICPIDNEAQFFQRLFTVITQVIALQPPNASEELEGSPHSQERTSIRTKEQGILQGVALGVLVVIAGGLENLQQNSILDYLSYHSNMVWDALMGAFSGSTHFLSHEMAMQLLALLLNYRKHEVRNRFAQQLVQCDSSQLVTCMFAMEALLTRCVHDVSGTSHSTNSNSVSPGGGGSRTATGNNETQWTNGILEWAEQSTFNALASGTAIASSLGAWITGITPGTSGEVSPDTSSNGAGTHDTASSPSSSRIGSSQGSRRIEHGSSVYGDSSSNCATTLSVAHVPRLSTGKRCNLGRWIRVRFALLAVYEIVCNSGNSKRGIEAFVTHDVMPWAVNDGGIEQPVSCPIVVIQALTLLSFCMQSGNGPVAKLAVLILQCLCEDKKGVCLLFATGLDDGSGLVALKVFQRPHADAPVKLVAGCSATTQGSMTDSTSIRNSFIGGFRGVTSPTADKNAIDTSAPLAAAIYKQLALLLQLEVANPRHSVYFRNGERALNGALCGKVLDVLHRMILYQVKRRALQAPVPECTDWKFLIASLMKLVSAMGMNDNLIGLGGEAVVLSEKLVRVINLLLVLLDGDDKRELLYGLVQQRAAVESWKRFLQSPAQAPRGQRLLHHEFGNIRTIILHFSQSIATNPETGTLDISKDTLMLAIQQAESRLKLQPHDRQYDGIQTFVEHPHESHTLRAFLRQLLKDMKMFRPFVKRV